MQHVTRRGLVKAGLCCAVIAAATTPFELAPALAPWVKDDVNYAVKLRLSKFIANTYKQPIEFVERIVNSAFANAAIYNVSPLLILAVVAKESSFSPLARSNYGAVGLMQVVPRFHPKVIAAISHPDGLLNPESNISAGTTILRGYLYASKGNVAKALHRYSGGARRYFERVSHYRSQFADIANSA